MKRISSEVPFRKAVKKGALPFFGKESNKEKPNGRTRKKLEEILRMFDKAPSPSSENSVQNQAQQNNKQPRQIPQRQRCSQQTVHSSKQSSKKGKFQSNQGRNLSLKRQLAGKRRLKKQFAIAVVLALILLVLFVMIICKGCSGTKVDVLAGKWDFDGTTAYEFDGNGVGTMVLPSVSYDFKYEINGNELYIDFINESVHDSTYSFTVQTNTLTLVGGNDTAVPGKVYELTKQE